MHLDKLIEWLENKTLAKVGMIRQTHIDPQLTISAEQQVQVGIREAAQGSAAMLRL